MVFEAPKEGITNGTHGILVASDKVDGVMDKHSAFNLWHSVHWRNEIKFTKKDITKERIMENKDLETIKEVEVITTAQLIQEGIAKGSNLEALEKILLLREKDDAFKARKAFAKGFALAQANILPVLKKKPNKQTNSKYADLADVIEKSQPIYTKEGFSVTFNEGDCPKENHVRVLADVLHYQGHKEQYHFDVPMDGKGLRGNENMTAIHGKASSISYGRRYLMCMIWNIPTADNDGNTMTTENITPAQLKTLDDLIKIKKIDKSLLLTYLGTESLESLPSNQYTKALSAINVAKRVAE